MSLEVISRRLKARQAEPEPAPAPGGSLDAALDALVKERVEQALAEQDQPQRRNRHIPSYAQDFDQGFTSSPQPSPAAAPITPGDFSAVLEKNEVGRTIAITATSHGKRQRFVVQRDGRGRAVSLRLEGDAHEPLPLPEHSKND